MVYAVILIENWKTSRLKKKSEIRDDKSHYCEKLIDAHVLKSFSKNIYQSIAELTM